MRVAFDATAVVAGDTGVARYTAMLLRELAEIDDVELVPFAIGRGLEPPRGIRHIGIPLRVVHRGWRHLRWPSAERLVGAVDVVHAPDMVPPPSRAPVVLTVHDVLPTRLPHLYSPRARRIAAASIAAARSAAVVICDCQSTARDTAEVIGRDVSEMVVAPPGPLDLDAALDPARIVKEPYVLAVGSITPRKAFDVAARAVSMLGPPAPLLVVAGPDGWRAEDTRRAAGEALGDRVRFLGRVSDVALARLYRDAEALVHPSLAEGFGIPVLEALAAGTPVVAGDIAPVREIAGNAAVYATPGDAGALAEALRTVVIQRVDVEVMLEAGRKRAADYTWSRTASAVVGAYRRAAAP